MLVVDSLVLILVVLIAVDVIILVVVDIVVILDAVVVVDFISDDSFELHPTNIDPIDKANA
nr:MAG TPA: hypothetical protein [Caudoviricetes sp.]